MKKIAVLLGIMIMGLLICACGGDKKAYEASKAAYDNIDIAYEITQKFGEDIYEAWRIGIYDKDEISVKYLASELNLSEEEITEGIVYTFFSFTNDMTYEEAPEDKKQVLRDSADIYFTMFEEDLFSACVELVRGAYSANGKITEAQNALNEAKAQMKELSEKFSDYEHYPNLKGYYTTTSSFFDFCQKPTGSFEQVKETINNYRNTARDYASDLDYIFEE